MTRPTKRSLNVELYDDGSDRISDLPKDVLCHIISSLSIDEAARSSILSKRWKPLWMHTTSLEFDQEKMTKPLSQLLHLRSGKEDDILLENEDVKQYATLVGILLDSHLGELTSCHFKHFPLGIGYGKLETLVELALKKYKNLSNLSLECEYLMRDAHMYSSTRHCSLAFVPKIFSNLCSLELTFYAMDKSTPLAFDGCGKLKTLKLKRMCMDGNKIINGILENCLSLEELSVVESIGFEKIKIRNLCLKVLELRWMKLKEVDVCVEGLEVLMIECLMCPPKGFKIDTPNLKIFRSSYNSSMAREKMIIRPKKQPAILKTQDIFENCSNLLESDRNIFRNLLTMSFDMDLNKMREVMALSFVLGSCINLETLEITIPAKKKGSKASNGDNDDCALPYPKSMFWERREMYNNCINHKIRFVKIRGFTCGEQEVQFVKYLITRATVMKKITIICTTYLMVEKAKHLLLEFPKASIDLSIILMSEYDL